MLCNKMLFKQNGQKKCVMITAGEASGDLHGGNLVRALRKMDESIFFCGVGGEQYQEEVLYLHFLTIEAIHTNLHLIVSNKFLLSPKL